MFANKLYTKASTSAKFPQGSRRSEKKKKKDGALFVFVNMGVSDGIVDDFPGLRTPVLTRNYGIVCAARGICLFRFKEVEAVRPFVVYGA